MKRINVDRRVVLVGVGGAVAGSLLTGTAQAGQLNPPPGPITPTGKSLDEVASRSSRTASGVANPCIPVQSLPGSATALHVISEPGSYYLTQNIVGAPGRHGIVIASDDVDLDGCGFHMIDAGGPPPGPTSSGIVTDRQNVTVYDLTLRGWHRAVDFENASLFVLWDIASLDAASAAFIVGSSGQVYDCDAYTTPGLGFSLMGTQTVVEECGAWSCGVPFSCLGVRNLLLANCATDGTTGLPAFQIAQGNSHGPIVVVSGIGDISAVTGTDHPGANFVY